MVSPVQVGAYKPIPEGSSLRSKYNPLKYTDLVKQKIADIEGWARPQDALPIPFDMLYLKTPERTYTGWWTGSDWEGYRLPQAAQVVLWKFRGDYECCGE